MYKRRPLLTADWEYRLKESERCELQPGEFMDGIDAMLRELVATYQVIQGAEVLFPSDKEVIGKCPRCGNGVTENKRGFFCEGNDCSFALWKNNKFFTAKKKELTKTVAVTLLKNGRVCLKGCYSEKTGKSYDADIILKDDGKYVNFTMEFGQQKGKKK